MPAHPKGGRTNIFHDLILISEISGAQCLCLVIQDSVLGYLRCATVVVKLPNFTGGGPLPVKVLPMTNSEG